MSYIWPIGAWLFTLMVAYAIGYSKGEYDTKYAEEMRIWNDGICKKTGEPWRNNDQITYVQLVSGEYHKDIRLACDEIREQIALERKLAARMLHNIDKAAEPDFDDDDDEEDEDDEL